MKNKKRMIVLVTVLALTLSFGTALASNQNLVNIFINGQQITSDVEPVIVNGRTMVPLRFIAENFGATVTWDGATKSVLITKAQSEGTEGTEGAESGSGHTEAGESGDPSSPILKLTEGWDGVVNGMRTAMTYDATNRRFYGIVQNVTNQTIKGILIELNLKQGTKTVVELGPKPVGDLQPGEKANVELLVSNEPEAVGVQFDAWEIHPEAEGLNTGEGSNEGSNEGPEGTEGSGSGEANESHSSEGAEGSEAGEEGTSTGAQTLMKSQTYDATKNGGRLVLSYNSTTKAFEGTLKNVGNQPLTRARVEIHLNTGTELGPTTPVDLQVGQTIQLKLPTPENFTTWVTHAEFGVGEGSKGAEGSEGREGNEGSEGTEGGTGEAGESHNESTDRN